MTPENNPLVGIFDSGVGGFSVFQKVQKITSSDILYFGDCARAPYGNRTEVEISSFIKEILFNLQAQGATHFVSACNSMSVFTTDKLLEECNIPSERYIDMIRAFKENHAIPETSRLLVLGTQATIASGVYQSFLQDKVANIFEYASILLAGVIEQGGDSDDLYEIIKPTILYAKEVEATHILYACTHYPLAHNIFKQCANDLDWDGQFIDPAVYVAQSVKRWNISGDKKVDFQTSKITDKFSSLSKNLRD